MRGRLHQNVILGMLGGVALVLRQFDFPLLPIVPFLKFDLSEFVLLFAGWMRGYPGVLIVAAIRDLLNFLIKGGEMGLPIGAITSFLASASYFGVFFYFEKLRENHHFKGFTIIQGMLATFCLTLVMVIVNYYFSLPLYLKLFNLDVGPVKDYLLYLLTPFNFLKGGLVSIGIYAMNQTFREKFQ